VRRILRRVIGWCLRLAMPAAFPLVLLLLYGFARSKAVSSARTGVKPRVAWVCAPIINIKYGSEALRKAGYFSRTVVFGTSAITDRPDFDLYRYDLVALYRRFPLTLVIEPYIAFLHLLVHFDVFHFFYDGGILLNTPYAFLELQILRRFGKKVVVMPYGGDVHVLSQMRNPVYKFGQLYHYGRFAVPGMRFRMRRIEYFSTHADCCVGSAAFDSLYRWDLLPVSYLAIDTALFRAPADYRYESDGMNAPVRVAHTPNHRIIKGTEYIAAAIERLKSEGFQVEFLLLENLKNTEVRRVLEHCDVLVELLVSGYGLSGIEGMALAKPVVSNFQGDTSALKYYSYLDECPIVRADFESIYDKLKWLIQNPDVRRELGEKGRRYAEKYHSYASQQIIWDQVYRKIWHGEEVDLMLLFHPLLGRYASLYQQHIATAAN